MKTRKLKETFTEKQYKDLLLGIQLPLQQACDRLNRMNRISKRYFSHYGKPKTNFRFYHIISYDEYSILFKCDNFSNTITCRCAFMSEKDFRKYLITALGNGKKEQKERSSYSKRARLEKIQKLEKELAELKKL